jgi:hypothetical protein
MDAKVEALLNSHKQTIFFYKAFGSWAGGDVRELAEVAKAMGMPEHEINYGCSSCLGNMVTFIFNNLDPKEYEAYKQQNGI